MRRFKFSKYIKNLSLVFASMVFLFGFVNSISSAIVSDDLYCFSESLKMNKQCLTEGRLIFGTKGDLAFKIKNNEYPFVITNNTVIYGVGINTDEEHFSLNNEIITPIESGYLRYFWSDEIYKDQLIQWLKIVQGNKNDDFEDGKSIIVSKKLFDKLTEKDSVTINSPFLKSGINVKIVGYYDLYNLDYLRVSDAFYYTYNEPVFMNRSLFTEIFGDEESYNIHFQNDVIIDAENYNASALYKVFKSNSWKEKVVVYDLYKDVFHSMKTYSQKNILLCVVFAGAMLVLFGGVIFFISFLRKRGSIIFRELFLECNPFVFLVNEFLALFILLMFGKLLNFAPLYYPPSFGVTIAFFIIISILYVFLYFGLKHRLNLINSGDKNEHS